MEVDISSRFANMTGMEPASENHGTAGEDLTAVPRLLLILPGHRRDRAGCRRGGLQLSAAAYAGSLG